jgi:ferredoxin
MKIAIDAGACIGAGQCVLSAPAVFDQDERDGTVVLLQPEPSLNLRNAVLEAAEKCPARVIEVDE